MNQIPSFAIAVSLALPGNRLAAQQTRTPPGSPSAPATFDAAAVRRRAAQMAEFRALLADPDPGVRLIAMQDAIELGDSAQREMAIEAGLASNEAVLIHAAMRGVLANSATIIITFSDKDGDNTNGDRSMRLSVAKFDKATGRLSGPSLCNANDWAGQFQGATMSCSDSGGWCRGSLTWSAETGDFRGQVNNRLGSKEGEHAGVWKPR